MTQLITPSDVGQELRDNFATPVQHKELVTDIDIVAIMDKMINTFESMDKSMYKPLASTIHNHVPFTDQLGTTEFSTVGLWFMAMFGTAFDSTVDAESYMSRAVDPVLGHELHTLLLILNNEFDIAMQFDGRFESDARKDIQTNMPNRFEHSVYNSWAGFDNHMKELVEIRETFEHRLRTG